MKKTVRTRMACLLLALATVLVSAPMLVLPLAAAETAERTYEKSIFNVNADDENCGYQIADRSQPAEGEEEFRKNTVTFQKDWSIGRLDNDTGAFYPYVNYNAKYKYIADEKCALWGWSGLYAGGSWVVPTYCRCVIRYTAPYSGIITVTVPKLTTHKETVGHEFGIRHNGVLVGETGAQWTAVEKSSSYSVDSVTLWVGVGDTVDFIVRREAGNVPAGSQGESSRFTGDLQIEVEYTEYFDFLTGSVVNTPTVVMENNKLATKSDVSVEWKGGWKYIIYENTEQSNRLNSGMICDRRGYHFTKLDANGAGDATDEFLGPASRDRWNVFYVKGNSNSYWNTVAGRMCLANLNNGVTAGKQYTIPENGYYSLSFTEILLDQVTNVGWQPSDVGFAIYQNGLKVWPSDTEWYQPTAIGVNEAPRPEAGKTTVFAAKGDVIEFVARNLSFSSTVRGIVLDGQVAKRSEDVTASVSYASKAAGGALRSNTDEVKYFGGWQFISYGGDMANVATVAANRVISTNTDPSKTYYTSIACKAGLTGEAQGASSVLCYSHSNWGNIGAMALIKGDIVGYRYTAPKSGFIKLSVDHLGIYYAPIEGETETSANSAFAIYVGGEKVWPAGEAWQTFDAPGSYETDASLALPTREFYIRAGETVEFLCKDIRPSDAKDASAWANRGNEISGTVTYTKFAEATATGSARIDGNIGFTFGTVADDEHFKNTTVRNIRSDVGTVEGSTIRGIAPNEMTSPITYEVYADVTAPDGTTQTEVLVKTGTTSVAAYLRSLATDGGQTEKTKDMALALLHYGAAAQKHFATGEIAEENLADYGMGEVSFTVGEATSDYAHTLPDGSNPAYYFSSATLLLLDELHMKVNLDLVEGRTAAEDLTKLTLQVADNEAFAGAASYTVSARADDEGHRYLKADFAVPTKEFSKPFYVRLVDDAGNAVSSTLTYSVNTYIARMQGKGEQDEILRTIQILGVAAARYAQA